MGLFGGLGRRGPDARIKSSPVKRRAKGRYQSGPDMKRTSRGKGKEEEFEPVSNIGLLSIRISRKGE